MPITTAEELERAGDIGRCELVRGELRMMTPAGADHGWITVKLTAPIANHVKAHDLGRVYAAETGFVLARNPDTVLAPDISFVRADRIAKLHQKGFLRGAPDLAVEVLSPDDRPGAVRTKTGAWLEAGAHAVWVVDPAKRSVAVHEPGRETVRLGEADTLRGGAVLPGFAIGVAEIFG